MKIVFVVLFFLVEISALAQVTMNTSGNWATATNWSGNNIGNVVSENVTVSNNTNPTVFSGSSFTVGNVSLNNNNDLVVNSGGVLNIGDAANPRSMTANNNAVVTIGGTLEVWADLIVNNNIVWNITGHVIIHGDVQLNNNANLNVAGGTLEVGGNLTAANNTNVSVPSGGVIIGGTVSIGNGSNLSGCTGCFQMGGSCTGPTSFCAGTVLPITITSFSGIAKGLVVDLEWTTTSEINFDKFIVETSMTGRDFREIGAVQGHGTTGHLVDYSFEHSTPSRGQNYYRLKGVDYDGSFQLSYFIRVNVNQEKAVTVSPNPVLTNAIEFLTNFAPAENDIIRVYSDTGVIVAEHRAIEQAIFAPSLSRGIYLLHYITGDQIFISRFVIAN